jgi:hypothetical protein
MPHFISHGGLEIGWVTPPGLLQGLVFAHRFWSDLIQFQTLLELFWGWVPNVQLNLKGF